MSVLKEVKALRDKALGAYHKQSMVAYDLTRDELNNLHVQWSDGYKVKIPIVNFRPYQREVRDILLNKVSKRILVEWPRRAGKEVTTWNMILDFAISDPGMYLMVYPTNVRARKILWEGAMLDLGTGLSIKFLDMIPKRLLARKPNDADMTIHLSNGSLVWIVGCDIDPEKLRGTNPRGIVYCELAFSDPKVLYSMMPVLRQNGGWLFGQSTYNGMNHFYWMLKKNQDDPLWFCREESINTLVDEENKPYITDEDVDEDRRAGMPEYLIQQEYYGNVQINEETKYFAHAINKVHETERIIKGFYLPNKPVYAFYDIGVSDCTAITLVQFEPRNGKLWPAVIGYIENNNQALAFYVSEIRTFCNNRNLVLKAHYVPHDGANRNFGDGLKTTQDYLNEMGEMAYIVKRPTTHKTAIEAIRQKLYMTTFNEENTQRLIDCLSNYEKEFDVKMGKFKDHPKHDWSSHGVKSYQTLALALDGELINELTYDVVYLDENKGGL
jgi:hypothetical protein